MKKMSTLRLSDLRSPSKKYLRDVNDFWFPSQFTDWMPKFREANERYKESLKLRQQEEKKIGDKTAFKRANDSMACSERRIVK